MFVYLFLFLYLLIPQAALQNGPNENHHLAVIYDRWLDFSPSGRRLEDIHAKTSFQIVASAFDLTVSFMKIPSDDLVSNTLWRSPNVSAVVSIGECAQNTIVQAVSKKMKKPFLLMNYEPCPVMMNHSLVLPLYKVKLHRRYQCMTHILYRWIAAGSQAGINSTSSINALLPKASLEYDKENYRLEYLNCVGPDLVLDINEIDPDSPPPEMEMALAKRFLNGRKAVIATIHRPPFVILTMSGDEIIDGTGFCLEMLNTMAKRFNFTYKLVPPDDGNWGAPVSNSPYFNGMVGMVQREVVDFAIGSFTITYIRETVIDFTYAFYEEPTTILIPPPEEEDNFLAFLSPFTWEVWLVTMISVFIVGFCLWALSTFRELPVLYPHNARNVTYTLARYIWDCAVALIAQANEMKQTEPVRLLNGIWWAFSFILIYTYTGNLIAFLTVPKVSALINSLEELAAQREVLWTYRAKTAHETLFSTAPSPSTYQKIGQLLKEKPDLIVKTDQEGVEAVLTGKIAFIKEKSWLDFAMEKDYLETKQCRLYQVNQLFFSAGFGWVLQEDVIYKSLFNAEILRMSQSGLFAVWRRKYWPKPNKCTANRGAAGSGPRALHLGNFLGHFFVLGVGTVLALIVFIVEKIYYNVFDRNKTELDRMPADIKSDIPRKLRRLLQRRLHLQYDRLDVINVIEVR